MEEETVGGPGDALALVDAWPARHASAAVLIADAPVVHGDADRVYEWASVTKLLTTMAVLVAVEEGTLSFDEPAGPEGSTIRHLLSHCSGLPGLPDSRSGPDGLPTSIPAPVDPPGSRRVYSNIGIEVLAATLVKKSGLDFRTYLAEAVTEPLGMTTVHLAGSPAWGARGSLWDLVALTSELRNPRLVSTATLDEATSVNFPHLSGVLPGFGMMRPNDWGLGFEIRDSKSPHWTGEGNSPRTFGHFGQSGSFLWVDPEAGLACCALCDRSFGSWAKEAWPQLADAVLESAGS